MNEVTVPAIIPAATEGNLTNLIAERAWFEPERITMSRPLGDGWQPLTARQVEEEIRATAKGLVAAGIQIGDRVAIMARTRYEWTILDFAIWYAGGCVVPIYETSSPEQVDWILNDSGSVGLIVETPAHRELVTPVIPSHTKHIWIMTDDVLSTLRTTGSHISDEEIRSYIATKEPLLLAGGASLDGIGAPYIAHISGDASGVLGLSMNHLRKLCEDLGHPWHSLRAS